MTDGRVTCIDVSMALNEDGISDSELGSKE
jgi:hypothetical protein